MKWHAYKNDLLEALACHDILVGVEGLVAIALIRVGVQLAGDGSGGSIGDGDGGSIGDGDGGSNGDSDGGSSDGEDRVSDSERAVGDKNEMGTSTSVASFVFGITSSPPEAPSTASS